MKLVWQPHRIHSWSKFLRRLNHITRKIVRELLKQAGAELGQAQTKLELG